MKIGSLFSGYGGLDMAVAEHFGAELAWYAEYDKPPAKIMAAHHPDVTNHWDVTTLDWNNVEPVDILTGGYPCQPFSNAGLRKGQDDERHLWPYVRDGISALRPRYVVLENVRGHLTLGFADVIADLARVGYDAEWGLVRASDTGAPHGRARLFIVAYPHGTGLQGHLGAAGEASTERHGHAESGFGALAPDADGGRHGQQQDARGVGSLESRPAGEAPERQWARGLADAGSAIAWGKYEPAIRRWEAITRPAPAPTILGVNGRPSLNPAFVEWMMGLPHGHVTGHGLRPAQELKMLGNGVVPQQAKLALELLT